MKHYLYKTLHLILTLSLLALVHLRSGTAQVYAQADQCLWNQIVLSLGPTAKACDQLAWSIMTWDDTWENTMSDELNGNPAHFVNIRGQDENNLNLAKNYITAVCRLPNLELTHYVPQQGKAWVIIHYPDGSLSSTQYFDHSCYNMIP